MCGLAGLCLADGALLDATAVTRLLTAGIAERGSDATGFAYLDEAGDVQVEKDSLPLARYFERLALPAGTRTAIAHVREFTKGVPGVNDNNHPIRYGSVVGAHNGHLANDDALFARFGKPRSTPRITVDSEAIMMLADTLGDVGEALELVHGAAAVAILRDGRPDRLTLAKRARRTLHLGRADGICLFASTRAPLELAARVLGIDLHLEELADGTLLELHAGEVVERRRFHVDPTRTGRHVEYPETPGKQLVLRRALAAFPAARRSRHRLAA
jgi:glutamine phosphoribosylpyrophosphate amidotransferase